MPWKGGKRCASRQVRGLTPTLSPYTHPIPDPGLVNVGKGLLEPNLPGNPGPFELHNARESLSSLRRPRRGRRAHGGPSPTWGVG